MSGPSKETKVRGGDIDKLLVGRSLTVDHLEDWEQKFQESPFLPLSRNILYKNDPLETLASREAIVANEKVFNLSLKGIGEKGDYPGPITHQADAATCWIFAGTNVLRYHLMDKLKLGDFQLSQSYLIFYHKLERANYYLEGILETKDEEIDSRIVSYINDHPAGDGGQWDLFINLVEKYGVVPEDIFPKSYTSGKTDHMNEIFHSKLKEYGIILRSTKDQESIIRLKTKFMNEMYNFLTITMGKPPRASERFTWNYHDKDNKFKTWSGTPLKYYHDVVVQKGMDPKEHVNFLNDPRHPYEINLELSRGGNVLEGRPLKYVNAQIEVLEDAVIAGIKANTPVWFGMDIDKDTSKKLGIMDLKLFDLKSAYGFDIEISKADRLRMRSTSNGHIMAITAVHLDEDGRPVKYKVENSWGKEKGDKGWYVMSNMLLLLDSVLIRNGWMSRQMGKQL